MTSRMGRKQQAPKAGGLSALHKPGNTTSAFRVLDWGLPGPPASTGRTCEQCRRQILKETLDMVNLPSGSEIAANLFSHALAAARTRQLALEELLGQAEKLKAQLIKQHVVNLYKAVASLLLQIIAIVLYLQNRGFGRDIGGDIWSGE